MRRCRMVKACAEKAAARERGDKFYFTGKPCARGHVARRRITGVCTDCEKVQWEQARKPDAKVGRGHKCAEREAALAAGAKQYSTGVPCRNGHDSPRWVSTYKCVQCDLDNHAKRRREDPKFREQASKRHKEWRANNLERALAHSREWYANNKERSIELASAWKKNNREAWKAIRRRYYSNSPVPLATTKARMKRVQQATPPWIDMKALREFYVNCPDDMVGDHMIPLKGVNENGEHVICGLHVPWNLQPLTHDENSAKSNKWPWQPGDERYTSGAAFLFQPISTIE